MGVTTKYNLPYPELTDQANVPEDMKKLCEKIEDSYENFIPHKYKIIIDEDKEAGEEIEIPCSYKVNAGVLDIYLNGERLIKSSDDAGTDGHYCEIGSNGSISNKIKSTSDWNLESNDTLEFIVRGEWS